MIQVLFGKRPILPALEFLVAFGVFKYGNKQLLCQRNVPVLSHVFESAFEIEGPGQVST
jgi:hypothetical protein